MSKKTENGDKDGSLFRQAMRGVTPLKHTKISIKTPTSTTPKRKRAAVNVISKPESRSNKRIAESDYFSDYETLPPVSKEELLYFAKPGIQHKILRNLRNGKYNIEATLDLHGLHIEEARESLHQFLLECYEKDLRHVLIIHGKGHNNARPILKNKINHWLRQASLVLAFCSANLRHGGSGAVYLLLKGRC